MIRHTVYFSGQVQGVGFRYTTQRIARRYTVSGYVQNLPDGRVLLIVEGEPQQVKTFVDHVARTMRDYIHEQIVEARPATGEFAEGFHVRL